MELRRQIPVAQRSVFPALTSTSLKTCRGSQGLRQLLPPSAKRDAHRSQPASISRGGFRMEAATSRTPARRRRSATCSRLGPKSARLLPHQRRLPGQPLFRRPVPRLCRRPSPHQCRRPGPRLCRRPGPRQLRRPGPLPGPHLCLHRGPLPNPRLCLHPGPLPNPPLGQRPSLHQHPHLCQRPNPRPLQVPLQRRRSQPQHQLQRHRHGLQRHRPSRCRRPRVLSQQMGLARRLVRAQTRAASGCTRAGFSTRTTWTTPTKL